MEKRKRFGDKIYKQSGGTFSSKTMANASADSAKDRGYNARIVKTRDKAGVGYKLFIRKRAKKRK